MGPSDLSVTLTNGAEIEPHSAKVEAALDKIIAAAQKAGKIAGLYCVNAERAVAWRSAAFASWRSAAISPCCAPAPRHNSRRSRADAVGRLATLLIAGLVVATSVNMALGQSQSYPNRPVTIVVAGAAGGGGDFTARLVGEGLSRALGQQFVVENRTGANGNVAATYVSRAVPDGYTLLLGYSGSHVANPALYKTLQWDPVKSFAPVALAIKAPHAIVAYKDLPVANLTEFLAYAKAHPGQVNFGSAGVGSIQHIGGEQMARMIGTKKVHVAYRGGAPAVNDLLAGTIQLLITTPPSIVGNLGPVSIRGLAMASKTRHPMLPELPTTAEAGLPGFQLDAWFAFYAPAGTPQPAIDVLAAEIEKIVKSADFKRRAEESGTYAVYMSPAELGDFTRSELAYWSDVIKKAGITLE